MNQVEVTYWNIVDGCNAALKSPEGAERVSHGFNQAAMNLHDAHMDAVPATPEWHAYRLMATVCGLVSTMSAIQADASRQVDAERFLEEFLPEMASSALCLVTAAGAAGEGGARALAHSL